MVGQTMYITVLVVIVIAAINVAFIVLSLTSLDYDEYDLDYISIMKAADKNGHARGTHFLSFQHSFMKSVKGHEFGLDDFSDSDALISRKSDESAVLLEISFQYEFQSEKLYSVYMKYSEKYEEFLIKRTINVYYKIMSLQTPDDYESNREDIAEIMNQQLEKQLLADFGIIIKLFQVKNAGSPCVSQE